MGEVLESYYKYMDYMYEAKNIYKCDGCPENLGLTEARNPCGMRHCIIEENIMPSAFKEREEQS